VTGPGDAELRERVRGLLQAVDPPAAPVDFIIRRGRARRLRRAGAVAGGLALAAIIAVATLLTPSRAPGPAGAPLSVIVPAAGVTGADGVFARGTADGLAWRLALQDIADPGYGCLAAITVNGTDANLVEPNPQNYAAVAFGPAAPGLGFAFIQLPADVAGVVLDGRETVRETTATVCGLRYRLAGFAYRLAHPPRVTAAGTQTDYQLPLMGAPGPGPAAGSQTYGIWTNVGSPGGETAQGTVASGRDWSMTLLLDAGGDCYEFNSVTMPGNPITDACGPVGTPDGTETIVALPLSSPPARIHGPTGYALQVSPATYRLKATLSDGSTQLVTPHVVGGRRYAAFSVGTSLRLERLTWLDAAGKAFASTTALPRSGYTQFQP
jgi:hypothetical protein